MDALTLPSHREEPGPMVLPPPKPVGSTPSGRMAPVSPPLFFRPPFHDFVRRPGRGSNKKERRDRQENQAPAFIVAVE